MEIIYKISILGIFAAIAASLIKKNNAENALVLSMGAAVAILLLLIPAFQPIMTFFDRLSDIAGISPAILSPVIKSVGISIITRIGSDVCKDAGQAALASSVEIGGSIVSIIIALPLFESVLSLIRRFL